MTFHELHEGVLPLLLPNAWDVPSALAFIDCGFSAVGTTSFGVASCQGSPDGGRATKEANLTLAHALERLPCDVSMDVEDGYSDDPDEVAEYVAALCAAGTNIVGINVEDSIAAALIPPDAHAAKIRAIKRRSPDLFVNARVDTYWFNQDATVAATIARAEHYVEAGADGIFVPGVAPEAIAELTAHIERPVNVLAIPGRSLADLGRLGVRRVSTGSLPYRAAIHAAAAAAVAVREGLPVPGATPYGELQDRLTRYAGGNPPVATGPQ
jgi:2-methylisocitrate lyase-like PEP mutase family enzyme